MELVFPLHESPSKSGIAYTARSLGIHIVRLGIGSDYNLAAALLSISSLVNSGELIQQQKSPSSLPPTQRYLSPSTPYKNSQVQDPGRVGSYCWKLERRGLVLFSNQYRRKSERVRLGKTNVKEGGKIPRFKGLMSKFYRKQPAQQVGRESWHLVFVFW